MAAVACEKQDPGTGGTPAPPAPAYARFTDTLVDLLTGKPIPSGRIAVPGHPDIAVADGRFTVTESHRLVVGSEHVRVLVEAPGCVPRRTGVTVAASGLRVDLGYKVAPLDLVADPVLYDRWLGARVWRIMDRWDPRSYHGAIVFDRQVYASGRFAPGYEMEPTFLSAALQVATTDVARVTGGALDDGVRLASEMPPESWPDPADPRGWLLYYTREGPLAPDDPFAAAFGDAFGTVSGSTVSLGVRRRTTTRLVFEATRDAVGRYLPGTVPGSPAALSEQFGIIQYNRKMGQRVEDVPDYQD